MLRSWWLIALVSCGRVGFDARFGDGDGGASDSATVEARCDDAFQNGGEAGIDCGGPCAAKCPLDSCTAPTECVTGVCGATGTCQLAGLTWRVGPNILTARHRHDCVTTSGGAVYVVGGETNGSGTLSSVEILAAGATQFINGPVLQIPRHGHAVAIAADNTIYAALGTNAGGNSEPTVEYLPPQGSAWLPAQSGAPQQSIRGVIAADGRLYIPDVSVTGVYDTTQDMWLATAPAVSRDGYGIAIGEDGRLIYAIAGDSGGDDDAVAVYDIDAGDWTGLPPTPTPRQDVAAVLAPDGRIYAIGGYTGPTELARVDAYALGVDAWSPAPAMNRSRGWPCATLASDGRIFVIGGIDPLTSGQTVSTELYGPSVTLMPGIAPRGAAITLLGTGFVGDAVVSVSIEGVYVASAIAKANGDVSISFAAPSSAAAYLVRARDQRAQYPVVAELIVQ